MVNRRISTEAGIGIVELLVGLAVSLVLLGGMYVVFISSSTTHSYGEKLSRLQENARLAMHTIRREVMSAGYLGCLQDVNHFTNTLKTPDAFEYRFQEAVYGLDAFDDTAWLDDNDVSLTQEEVENKFQISNPIGNNDVLVLRGIDKDFRLFLEIPSPNAAVLKQVKSGADQIKNDDILMIADCSHAAVFQVTSLNTASRQIHHSKTSNVSPGNSDKDLGHTFKSGAEIVRPTTTIFYIRNNSANEPALFRRVIDKATPDELLDIELATGVENMQVRYREAGAAEYVTANGVTDWQKVVSVRVGLLMRSDPIARLESTGSAPAYDVDGDGDPEFAEPNDSRFRLVMSATISLRNHLR